MIVAFFVFVDRLALRKHICPKTQRCDLSANNGNWHGQQVRVVMHRISGFLIRPHKRKFDKDLAYIKKWLPEFGTEKYPKPIVEHSAARERALKVYADAVKENI